MSVKGLIVESETGTRMQRDEAIAKLKEHEKSRAPAAWHRASLFVRIDGAGEANANSDVDLFFDHPEGSLGLYELMDVKDAAARILGCKADIMTPDAACIGFCRRSRFEASAEQVF